MAGRFVPPAGPPRVLALGQLTNSIGDGAYWVCSVLYFARIVGLSPAQIGTGLTVAWAAGLLAGVPLGHLADRRGPRGTAIWLAAGTAAAVAGLLFVRSFALFVAVESLHACCECGLVAARQALLAGLVPQARRTHLRAYLQSAQNAGLSLGAAFGGVALHLDTRAAYLAVLAMDAACFLLAATVLFRVPAVPVAPVVAGEPKLAVLRDRPYALITSLNMVMLLYSPLLGVLLPLCVVQRTQVPRWIVAALFLLNTVTVVLFQVRVGQRVTDLRSATRLSRRAGMLMLGMCVVLAASAARVSPWIVAGLLVLAIGLQAFAEMMQAAGTWEISFGLAPSHRHGQYQGFFGMGMAVARMIGPLLLTTLVFGLGTAGWLLLGGLFLLSGLTMRPAVRWAERVQASAPPSRTPSLVALTTGGRQAV